MLSKFFTVNSMRVREGVLSIIPQNSPSPLARGGVLMVLPAETSSAFKAASTALWVLATKVHSPGLLYLSSETASTLHGDHCAGADFFGDHNAPKPPYFPCKGQDNAPLPPSPSFVSTFLLISSTACSLYPFLLLLSHT